MSERSEDYVVGRCDLQIKLKMNLFRMLRKMSVKDLIKNVCEEEDTVTDI